MEYILKTTKRKLVLNPLETLKIVVRGSTVIENIDIEHAKNNLKEGLLEMHLDFFQNKNILSNLNEHIIRSNKIFKIINGD